MRVIDRVRDALAGVTADIVLSANAPEAAGWMPGVQAVPDVHAGSGGLAGVHAALEQRPGADAVVVAWDMPFVTADLLALLLSRMRRAGSDAVVPESDSPHGIEPFCACYGASVRERLDAFLRQGGGAARDFLAGCTTARVPLEQIRRLGDPATLLLSVNDARDLDRARVLGR